MWDVPEKGGRNVEKKKKASSWTFHTYTVVHSLHRATDWERKHEREEMNVGQTTGGGARAGAESLNQTLLFLVGWIWEIIVPSSHLLRFGVLKQLRTLWASVKNYTIEHFSPEMKNEDIISILQREPHSSDGVAAVSEQGEVVLHLRTQSFVSLWLIFVYPFFVN